MVKKTIIIGDSSEYFKIKVIFTIQEIYSYHITSTND